jgi:hypothetical protein
MDFQSIPENLQGDSHPSLAPTPPANLSPSLSPGAKNRPETDPDLLAIVDAWPTLPVDVRKMIRGVVKALKMGKV